MSKRKPQEDETPRCPHPPQDRRPVARDPRHEWCEVCWEKVAR